MNSPEKHLPVQALAEKGIERLEKNIEKDRHGGVDVAAAQERVSGYRLKLDGMKAGGSVDALTVDTLSTSVASLEKHFLTRREIDSIPLTDESVQLDDVGKAYIRKVLFTRLTWLQERIADSATRPEQRALYQKAVEARQIANENAEIEQQVQEQNAWGKHNNESARKMADIVSGFLQAPASGYDAYLKGDVQLGHVSDAWEKMDNATKEQLLKLADDLVAENLHKSHEDGRIEDVRNVFAKSGAEKSILDKVLGVITKKNPGRLFYVGQEFDGMKSGEDKRSVADIGKQLRNAYLTSQRK